MTYSDDQLLKINGRYAKSPATIDVNVADIAYVIPSADRLEDGTFVDTFLVVLGNAKNERTSQIVYQRDNRTIVEFFAALNLPIGSVPLKLWTNIRQFNGRTLSTKNSLYDQTAIINDNMLDDSYGSGGDTFVRTKGGKRPMDIGFAGDQLGAALEQIDGIFLVYGDLSADSNDINTNAVMQWGTNVYTDVTNADYAVKLPQPTTGRACRIVNNTRRTIALFPSNVGGKINGVTDTAVNVPADGKAYEFLCTENPLPGAWTWTAPATTQYDSGLITLNTAGNVVISAANNAFAGDGANGYEASGIWSFDGQNHGLIADYDLGAGLPVFAFKEAAPWLGVTKVKVYTNLSANGANVGFRLNASSGTNYYNVGTNTFDTNGPSAIGTFGNLGYANQAIAGAALGVGALAANVGDPGTCWGEIIMVGAAGVMGFSIIGDVNGGAVANPYAPPAIADLWYNGMVSFQIKTNVNLVGFQFRFFIEHF